MDSQDKFLAVRCYDRAKLVFTGILRFVASVSYCFNAFRTAAWISLDIDFANRFILVSSFWS